MSVRSLRRIFCRAGLLLGLTVTLVIMAGAFPAIAPIAAQEEEEEATPTPTPAAPAPQGPSPAFKPSGGGSSGPGSSAPGSSGPASSGSQGSGPSSRPAAAAASVPPPPAVGAGVYKDALKNDRIFRPGKCQTFSAGGDLVPDGFRLVVIGPCAEDAGVADVSVQARDITVGDGDVALDFQVQDGGGLATVTLYVRNRERRLIGAAVNVGKGQASLFQIVDGEQTDLAYRDTLGDMVQPDGWNRLAVRVSGNDMWLLLNDQPALYASGVLADAGGVGLRLLREGRVTDETGTIVVFRDLTLSTLEGAEPGRGPTHP